MGRERYRVIRAGDSFSLAGKSLPGMPILIGPKGVQDQIQHFLVSRVVESSTTIGSIVDSAYILKNWLVHLRGQHKKLTDANNRTLSLYAAVLHKRGLDDRRINRTISVIFKFYLYASKNIEEFCSIVESPADGEVGRLYPLSTEVAWRITKTGNRVMRLTSTVRMPAALDSPARPTPDDEGVEKVLDALLSSSTLGHLTTARWLMASWMFRSTLRCGGVAGLTVSAVSQALLEAKIADYAGNCVDLEAAAGDPKERRRIMDAVRALRRRHRTAVFVMVKEKRGKKRKVPLPLEELEYNLDYIWDARPLLLRGRTSDALFPSSKTGSHLAPKSIGNFVKSAFKEAKVAGSAHRLRAYSAENIVEQAFHRAVALHGSAFDRESILMEAAEQLGHADPSSLGSYLNNAIGRLNKEIGQPVLIDDPDLAGQLKALVKVMREDEVLQQALQSFFNQHSIVASENLGLKGLREHVADMERRRFTALSLPNDPLTTGASHRRGGLS